MELQRRNRLKLDSAQSFQTPFHRKANRLEESMTDDETSVHPKRARGQRKTQDPCPGCQMHRTRCFCDLILRLDLKTRLSLIIHRKELRRTTNTGQLAVKALVNSEMLVRGELSDVTNRLDLRHCLNPDYQSVLFFPSETAIELNQEFVRAQSRPIQLIVPDGNWRQASKVAIRHPEIAHLPRVMIRAQNSDQHRLRAETTPEGMATLQAIAHALGIIEGDAVRNALLELYHHKLHRTIESRG